MDHLAVRQLHIACAALSIALFALRGGLMLARSRWLDLGVFRVLPHVVDTVLLGSAIWLAWIVRQAPLRDDWLTVKVALLPAYIMLGSVALKRGRTWRIRAGTFVLALVTVAWIVLVARARHPLGPLAGLL